ncbi:MAG: hypothetical protein IIB99_13145 [Planctomycetes bacterium]|nr:hypothetical protein [Planctomycetota bacterium]
MASWHRVARRAAASSRRVHPHGEISSFLPQASSLKPQASLRRSFSLIEVLLSVFILGIGVISIAALFPAGIAQQRQSVDDITGPIVAQNALAILRTKLRPEDFGTFEEFSAGPPLFTIDGDWPWLRPAFILNDPDFSSGTIDIFNGTGAAGASEPIIPSGIPYNIARHGLTWPIFVVTQQERYYPMASVNTGIRPPKPQYVWDCMFRRFQGKVMVAIFVYRTTIVGGGDVAYSVPPQLPPFDDVPPMPISLNITTSEVWADEGPWDANGNQFIRGTRGGEPYDTTDQRQSWQEPGQWILDQNNNLHRVLSQNRNSESDPVMAELVRPVPSLPNLWVYFLDQSVPDPTTENVVSNIWYIPREVTLDGVPVRLTTVYVTVREL